MARSTPATQVITNAGRRVALTAPNADGDIVEAGNGTFLVVANGSGGAVTVTLVNPNTYQGLDVADRVASIPAGETWHIPVPAGFRQDADAVEGAGLALVNYSTVASVTRGVGKPGA